MKHLDEKLLKLEGMMKTDVGKEVARVRGERLRVFRKWWVEEAGMEEEEEEEEEEGRRGGGRRKKRKKNKEEEERKE